MRGAMMDLAQSSVTCDSPWPHRRGGGACDRNLQTVRNDAVRPNRGYFGILSAPFTIPLSLGGGGL
jgi:hypothetical protein